MSFSKKKRKHNGKKSIPLAPPPVMKSRKKARIVTTLFHKHTRNRDIALQNNDLEAAKKWEKEIEAMGGRAEYQRASVCSTKHHSTSKWVMKVLGRMGWLHGFDVIDEQAENDTKIVDSSNQENYNACNQSVKRTPKRRNLQLLEVGAINTDLLDAAGRKRTVFKKKSSAKPGQDVASQKQLLEVNSYSRIETENIPYHKLDVRAIDIRSMNDRIEEVDFLKMPFRDSQDKHVLRYDVIVCSMVINCVTTPESRGKMLSLLFHHLRPGGMCFLTLPKLCLYQSKYITMIHFQHILSKCIGFDIQETKESPKVAFFVLKRPEQTTTNNIESSLSLNSQQECIKKWNKLKVVCRGKKYRNSFSVVLKESDILE